MTPKARLPGQLGVVLVAAAVPCALTAVLALWSAAWPSPTVAPIAAWAAAIAGALAAVALLAAARALRRADIAAGALRAVLARHERGVDPAAVPEEPRGEAARIAAVCRAASGLVAEIETSRVTEAHHEQAAHDEHLGAMRDMGLHIEQQTREALDEICGAARDLESVAQILEASSGRVSHDAEAALAETGRSAEAADGAANDTVRIGDAIHGTNDQMIQAAETARRIMAASADARALFDRLRRETEEIDGVSNLIGQIAHQTNMLALNATIEATRAGEAGRGFAVVAREVKTLATQTARASAEITTRLGGVRDRAAAALDAMDEISGRMTELDAITTRIAEALAAQSQTVIEVAMAALGSSESASDARKSVSAAVAEINDNKMSVELIHFASAQVAASLDALHQKVVGLIHESVAGADRRRAERFDVDISATMAVQSDAADQPPPPDAAVRVINISPLGARVKTDRALAHGAHIVLRPAGLPPLRARVVATDPDLRLEFVFANDTEAAAMVHAIDALKARACAA